MSTAGSEIQPPSVYEDSLPDQLSASPRGYMRLHHAEQALFGYSGITRAALVSDVSTDELSSMANQIALSVTCQAETIAKPDYPEEDRLYWLDKYGTSTREQIAQSLLLNAFSIRAMRGLPADAVIKFGSTPDDRCSRCFSDIGERVGEHCLALSMRRFDHRYKARNRTSDEESASILGEALAMRLIAGTLQRISPDGEGISWLTSTESIPMIDDTGQTVMVDAPYMLLTKGTLDALISARRA